MKGLVERDKKDMKPLIFKLGVALALSIAGYFASRFHSRPRLPPPPASSSGDKPENAGKSATVGAATAGRRGLKDELPIIRREEALAKIIHGTSTSTITTAATVLGLSPICKSSEDEEEFLLPEFNQIVVREFEAAQQDLEASTKIPMSSKFDIKDVEMEQEIAYLRNLVQSLQEREESLELQMLEYYGLKEQEATVRELENRLKMNMMEVKLLSLKIESMQDENQKLKTQVSDYSRVMTELESAKSMIKLLKRKLKSDGEQARDKLASLQQRIAVLQENEHKNGKNDVEFESKLERLQEVEDEAAELRKENLRLVQEKLDLVQKLEATTQMISSATLNAPEAVLEEVYCLREENKKLAREIEQLQTNRCADVEELVYLRWINACLRYELRNYQAPPGKTAASDLSRSLSPNSEEKAKELILEYANLGIDEKNISLVDFDSESCSSSQASTGECDDASFDLSLSTENSSSRKSKFIKKLKKLVLGKGRNRSKNSLVDKTHASCGDSAIRGSVSTCSLDDMIGRNSCDSISSCFSMEHASTNHLIGMESHANGKFQNKGAWSKGFYRTSFDVPRLRKLNPEEVKEGRVGHCKSDLGTSTSHSKMVSVDDSVISMSHDNLLDHGDVDVSEQNELKKYAEVLKSSHALPKVKKRSASLSYN
ncbi:protein CHUP1, chloroplastic-like isoform X2 [Phoenix dactylifera]|uniref:Protein CHUP1, chloroplastic-like isoform X2 n=1 Tax=Phoenix dactylifera TaxID=42345 RepID=A0A8B7BFC8_PHODC|nr:protein CHUP1, chloroplastic-like isoform X2 [Phoenix dactylifera]